MAEVEVEVRNAANTAGTTALSDAFGIEWQHQRNGIGLSNFKLPNTAAAPAEGAVVRGRLGGTGRFPWIIERRRPVMVSVNDEFIEATEFSGRGILCEWDDSLLHDAPTLSNLAQLVPVLDERVMAWYGPDYDPTGDGWVNSNIIAVQGWESTFYTGMPSGWWDGAALWIGPTTGDANNAPAGLNLFLEWVLIGAGPARLEYAGDNNVVAYVNGRRVGEGGDFRSKQTHDFEVTESGWLLLAFELLNAPDDGPPGGNPTAMIYTLSDRSGNVFARSSAVTQLLEYPASIPEVPLGRQITRVMIGNDLLDGVWTVAGTETTDANGATYPATGPMSYRLGADSCWAVLAQQVDTFIDITVDASGRTLRPFVKGTVGSASTLGLVTGYSTAGISAPATVNVVDLVWDVLRPEYTALRVRWARGRFSRGAGDRWANLDLGQVTDLATAEAIADSLLDLTADGAATATFELLPNDSGEWPYTSLVPHDTLPVPGPFGHNTALTLPVTAVTVKGGEEGDAEFIIEVGSLVEDATTLLERASRRGGVAGALDGAASAATAAEPHRATSAPARTSEWTMYGSLPEGTIGAVATAVINPPATGFYSTIRMRGDASAATGTTTGEVFRNGSIVATLSLGSADSLTVEAVGQNWVVGDAFQINPTSDGGHTALSIQSSYAEIA